MLLGANVLLSLDHLIGSPKALACDKYAPKAWTRFADIPALKAPNMEFVRGSVTSVDAEQKVAEILDLQSQETRGEQYDYLIAASGLRRVFPTVPQSLCRDEYLHETKTHKDNVENAQEGVVIVGGGETQLMEKYLMDIVKHIYRCRRCGNGR